MKKLAYLIPTLLIVPLFAFAGPNFTYLDDASSSIINLINGRLVPLLFGIAVIVFLWGLIKAFILGGTDEEKRKEGKQLMIWGILALVVMVSIWGIVNLLASIFGVADNNVINMPTTPRVR